MEIELNSRKYPGLVATIDDEDYHLVSDYHWHPIKSHSGFYAIANCRVDQKKTTVLMHRLILELPRGRIPGTDHVDSNGLKNCRSNLRAVTYNQNCMNRRKGSGIHSSTYKGVSWFKKSKKWRGQICFNHVRIYLGCFDSEIEAARAYDLKAIELFGGFAKLNFEGDVV